ncbi:MAG: F0F1 ATP synthase subunit B [Bacteroidales bacterium]|nr:F0F1 ATP synthase subunit B [Bacteroidales bacterium]MDE7073017.1 F0F1 ATP synthase subunit B [Bacteroidales bacterium]
MELVMPGVGVLFWTLLIFLLLFLILKKWAFPVINGMLEKREEKIATALSRAEEAQHEIARMKSDNEAMLASARAERERMLAEAVDMKNRIEEDSKVRAKAEYERIVDAARTEIERQKRVAIEEIRGEVAQLSFDIAEKILGEELSDPARQQAFIERELKNVKL